MGAGRLLEPSTAFPCPRYSAVSNRDTSFSSCCLYSCAAREVYCSMKMSIWRALGSANSHLQVLLLLLQVTWRTVQSTTKGHSGGIQASRQGKLPLLHSHAVCKQNEACTPCDTHM